MLSHVFKARRSVNDRCEGPVHIMMVEQIDHHPQSLFVRRHSLRNGQLTIHLLTGHRKMKVIITHVRMEDKIDIALKFGTTWCLFIVKGYYEGIQQVVALNRSRNTHRPMMTRLARTMFLGREEDLAGSNRYHTDDGYESPASNDDEMDRQINNTEHILP